MKIWAQKSISFMPDFAIISIVMLFFLYIYVSILKLFAKRFFIIISKVVINFRNIW